MTGEYSNQNKPQLNPWHRLSDKLTTAVYFTDMLNTSWKWTSKVIIQNLNIITYKA